MSASHQKLRAIQGLACVFLFSVFLVLSTVPGKKDVLKELFIHKKLIYEECNFPEAVWDGGRTRETFFLVFMTNMRNRGFTFHYTNL